MSTAVPRAGQPRSSGEPTTGASPVVGSSRRWRFAPLTGRRRPPVAVWLPALLVMAATLVPLVYLGVRAAEAGSGIGPLVFRARTARVLLNTASLAAGVGLGSALVAVPLAWLTTRTDLPGRRVWSVLATLPLVIPSYVGALTVVAALGPRGFLQRALEPLGVERLPEIYGFGGACLTLILFTYPFVYIGTRSALLGVDPAMEEAARSLGGGHWRTFFRCTLPQTRPAVVAGVLLAALYAVSDFGVVTLLRFDAFTRVIYVQYRSSFDRSQAAATALVLVVFASVILAAETRARGRAAYHRLGSGAARRARPVPLGRWRWPAIAFCLAVVVASLGLPVGVLAWWLVSGASGEIVVADLARTAANSVGVSAAAAVVATVAALPVAVLAVRYGGRLARLAERVTYLGYALPGIVVALAFVSLGAGYLPGIYQTLPLLVAAYVIRFLPQAVGATRAALLQVSPRVEEASRTLGRSGATTAVSVTLPLAAPGIGAGATLVFLTVMKELPVTLLLRPTEWDTLATAIWGASSGGAFGRAAAPALLLILLAAIPTVLLDLRRDAPRRGEG